MNFDSKEELYFSWWLDELIEAEWVLSYERSTPILLFAKMVKHYEKKLKTKTKILQKTILPEHIYTPDFDVVFIPEFAEKCEFFHNEGGCVVEIKGDYDRNNMTRLFKINQKWSAKELGIMVNLVKIPSFFKKTFTPKRYLLTDQTMRERKLNYKPRTLQQFMEG